ncbi:MAG: YfiR family protein, partial [Daejeonella sp.]
SSFTQMRPVNEYQVKAAFIYNFTRFIDWPAETNTGSAGPFIIKIWGDDQFSTYINDLVKGEKLGGRAIIVQRIDNVKEINQCNILFVSASRAADVKDLLPELNRKRILTVSDAANFARWGGIIRFFKEGNNLRLQINIDEAKASRLNISSKLLSLSKIYRAN